MLATGHTVVILVALKHRIHGLRQVRDVAAVLREFALGMVPFLTLAALNPCLTVTFVRICVNLKAVIAVKVFLIQLHTALAKLDFVTGC